MRIIIAALAAAICLGGCESLTQFVDSVSTPADGTASSASSSATAQPDARAVAAKAVCDWSIAAGIPDLKPGLTDTLTTRRKIAELHAAHQVACAKTAALGPTVPVPGSPASPAATN